MGVAIMQLVDAGKIDLAAPVSRYIDSLPESWRAVTIPSAPDARVGTRPTSWNLEHRRDPWRQRDGRVGRRAADAAQSAPGVRFSYNQMNYPLGKIIHSLSGQVVRSTSLPSDARFASWGCHAPRPPDSATRTT